MLSLVFLLVLSLLTHIVASAVGQLFPCSTSATTIALALSHQSLDLYSQPGNVSKTLMPVLELQLTLHCEMPLVAFNA